MSAYATRVVCLLPPPPARFSIHLCIPSVLALRFLFLQAVAVPVAGRALAHALPLEATLAPILAAQRGVLFGIDPADFPRTPVEIVLVSLTLVAQLGVELSGNSSGATGDDCCVAGPEGEEEGEHRRRAATRGEQRRGRQDAARAARLRRFLGEQAAAGEVKLCLGHAACRAESKDLARRAAALISLLQVCFMHGGGGGGGGNCCCCCFVFFRFGSSNVAA